jgi:hypothetical protein
MLKYYLKDGSREKGPFVLDDLKYQRIRPTTQVKIDGGQWRPIAEVPDLAFLLRLGDHTHSSASFAKPDQHIPYGDPAAEAKKRARMAVVIGIVILLLALGMSLFLNVSSN